MEVVLTNKLMSESINQDIVDEVKNFINDDPTKKKIIQSIIEYEENNPCKECHLDDREEHTDSCWSPGSDISMLPAYIGQLKNSRFINNVYESNNHTDLSLTDRASTKFALKEIEDEPDEYTDEWARRKVKSENTTIDDALDNIAISQDDRDEIIEIVSNNNALEYWSDFVAPAVKYRDNAKKAILVMLASPEDAHGNKGRINVLIYGPPGTGKSTIKSYLRDNFDAEVIDGSRVSKADLTYNKNNNRMGKLPQAHKGVLVIEEADEMDEKALGSTLTSLGETGQVEIRDMKIPAETRGVVLSNFESEHQILTEWSPESLNRFDFLIEFDLLDDEDKDETLDYLYKHFRKPNPEDNVQLFRKYLKLVRDFEPELDELEQINKFKRENINDIQNIREGISTINVAWTIARLNLDDVKLQYYKKAFDLVLSDESALTDKFKKR